MTGPGRYRRAAECWGRFDALARRLDATPTLALVDARVLRLHPQVGQALAARRVQVVALSAGEAVKSLARVEAVARAASGLPRSSTVLAVGGGTIGDVATVFAHLFKRGVGRLVQVPTTTLAAVDSSVGGKGAVNVGGVKNALGVFHFADEAWLCPELFETLSSAQRREGRFEAWKMAVTLDAATFRRWAAESPSDEEAIRRGRALKEHVVARDPYETRGLRVVLNFGHTFGHVVETVTGFRVRHGEAVGLGLLAALDVGQRLGVTPPAVVAEVEGAVFGARLAAARRRLAAVLAQASRDEVLRLLAADKKSEGGAIRMVLLKSPGRWVTAEVPTRVLPLPGRGSRSR